MASIPSCPRVFEAIIASGNGHIGHRRTPTFQVEVAKSELADRRGWLLVAEYRERVAGSELLGADQVMRGRAVGQFSETRSETVSSSSSSTRCAPSSAETSGNDLAFCTRADMPIGLAAVQRGGLAVASLRAGIAA